MKMKCSVIQDLMPSYVDDICSEDSKELVQEHVAECVQCKEKLEQMKNTEIVAGKASKKQVDYLKKIRSTITHKESLGKIMLVILIGIAYVGLFVGVGGLLDYSRIPAVVVSALFFCAAILVGNYRFSGGKIAAVEIGVSSVAFVLPIAAFAYLLLEFVNYEARGGEGALQIFGMDLWDVGPLYVNFLRVVALIPVLMLLYHTFGKRKNAYATSLNITAISYIVYVNDWLYHMDDLESSIQWMKKLTITQTVLAAVLAAASIIIYTLLRKFGKTSVV